MAALTWTLMSTVAYERHRAAFYAGAAGWCLQRGGVATAGGAAVACGCHGRWCCAALRDATGAASTCCLLPAAWHAGLLLAWLPCLLLSTARHLTILGGWLPTCSSVLTTTFFLPACGSQWMRTWNAYAAFSSPSIPAANSLPSWAKRSALGYNCSLRCALSRRMPA